MRLIEKFLEHPREQGKTYLEHLYHALRCGLLLSIASIACIIHSFIPFIFKNTATGIIHNILYQRCKEEKN
jgi:hypothetical protein